MSEDEWQFWIAYDKVEGVPCLAEQHAETLAMLDNLRAATIAPHVKEGHVPKPVPVAAFLPKGFYVRPKRRKKRLTLKDQFDIAVRASK